MMLFRESDKRISVPERGVNDEDGDESDPGEIVRYVAPANVVRDRLEIMGFTLTATTRAFNVALEADRRSHREGMERIRASLSTDFADDEGPVLHEMSVERWMEGLRQIRDLKILPTYQSDERLEALPPLVRYMLSKHLDGWYGFPSADVRFAIRLAVEVLPDEQLVYDLTELVSGGYFDSSDDLVEYADYLITEDFDTTRRVVVLTEGATDKWILARSLRVLYPHLADYYTFMDFEGARVAGGAGALASMVKAFVGAGIANRVVALFDNDTAGASALRSLQQIRLPPNIVALQFPSLQLAMSYPTIGPSGTAEMDVNGLAGSIELYLGSEILTDGETFFPVHWKGYDESMRRYQGEITGKREILERFEKKVADAEADNPGEPSGDWSGLRLILDRMRGAFHPADEAELESLEEAAARDREAATKHFWR